MHKLEADRKKKEFDERLKAIRSKVYNESGTADAESRTSSMMPAATLTPAAKQETQPLPSMSPMVPGARWSGGLARWNSSTPSPASSSSQQPSPLQVQQMQVKKLNIDIDEDDFSFRPPSIPGGAEIPISPIVGAAGALGNGKPNDTKFEHTTPGDVTMGALLSTIGISPSSRRSRSEPPAGGRSSLEASVSAAVGNVGKSELSEHINSAQDLLDEPRQEDDAAPSSNTAPDVMDQTKANSDASPTMSEGDKGGGPVFNFNIRGLSDKSIVSKTSSNAVELGAKSSGQDPPVEESEEETAASSLLGVTVVGSKRRKKKSGLVSVDEVSSKCSSNAQENESVSSGSASVRKPLDPDGVDWKDLEAKKREDIRQIKQHLQHQQQEGKKRSKAVPVDLHPGIVPEGDDAEFVAVMDRVKTCLTPRETLADGMELRRSNSLATPRSVPSQPTSFHFGGKDRFSTGSAAQSVAAPQSNIPKKGASFPPVAARSRFESNLDSRSIASARVDFFGGPLKPLYEPKPGVEIQGSTSEEKDDGIVITKSNLSETVSIKELRSRFEDQKSGEEANKSTMVGSGIYLKNREIQAMSSLGSETKDTAESSLIKSEANEDDTIGDGTLDTKKVLRYAKILERRGVQAADSQDSSMKSSMGHSIEKKDTSNSSKENYVAPKIKNKGSSFSSSPPVKLRKMAFEGKKNPKVAQTYQQFVANNNSPTPFYEWKKDKATKGSYESSLSSKTSKTADDVPPPPNNVGPTSMQGESPGTASVKDRIAVWGDQSRSQNQAVPRQQASPNKVMVPLTQQAQNHPTMNMNQSPNRAALPLQQQQQGTPPRTIAMNQSNNTPSPLWVANNQNSGQGYSPYGNNASPHHFKNSNVGTWAPTASPSSLHVQGMRNNGYGMRPSPVQTTRYESPIANSHQYDNDEEDGITLSPTFSEVSGLTLPTFDASRVSMQSGDVFDNLSKSGSMYHETMSPIARHRRQQEKKVANISKHPYLQRVNRQQASRIPNVQAAPSSDNNVDRLHELKTPKAGTSRREKIVNRVRASQQNEKQTNSREWQAQNVIKEQHTLSHSSSSGSPATPVRHFLPSQQNSKGKVAERVETVNRRTQKRNSDQHQKRGSRYSSEGDSGRNNNSLATVDCIRVD